MFNFSDHPHRRFNPLTRSWVLCSPHRAKRPWQGQVEKPSIEMQPAYDPNCYLCPRNERAGGLRNPDYRDTLVFQNDFSALLPNSAEGEQNQSDLLVAQSDQGMCRVICFSPRHDVTLAEMDVPDIRTIIGVWQEQYRELSRANGIRYVQIFENKGAMMGCSNPHPHGQIWASQRIPEEPAKEAASMDRWFDEKCRCLLCDYLNIETQEQTRIVCENESFVALVPFWAVWPFETMVLPREHRQSVDRLAPAECAALADILRRVACRYDNLFKTSFPYSMGIHQAPSDGTDHGSFHFHFHFYPPLLRSATVKKFMVGYELLAEPQRDITAEQSAEQLRNLSEIHYKQQDSGR